MLRHAPQLKPIRSPSRLEKRRPVPNRHRPGPRGSIQPWLPQSKPRFRTHWSRPLGRIQTNWDAKHLKRSLFKRIGRGTLRAPRLTSSLNDGVEGEVDLSAEAGKGVFRAWEDRDHFAAVQIEEGGRAIVWPDGIDLCADALYMEITGLRPEDLFPALKQIPQDA